MRIINLLICFLVFSGVSSGQNNKTILSGKLVDSSELDPIGFATITIFKARDTSIVTYRLSEPNGSFKVTNLPINLEFRAVITSSGYNVYRKEFQFTSSQMQIDFGTIKMEPDEKTLDEILMFSERPPITVRNDTIEFNASAFKTLPSALVEDMLKKLPGVEVDMDGNISVNNRRVNRILVDGKEFFGGDPQVATRNLPASLVDKVQVLDDKEESDRNPTMSKSELGQVINLKLKRSIKKGWFGKAYTGAGSNSDRGHYETGAIINSFRDTLQVSVLAYSNNINRAGFGFEDLDQIGGYRRSGFNSISASGGGDASIGSTGQGLQTSTGTGININHDPNEKLNLSFQYFFGQIINDYISKGNGKQFIADTILNTLTSSEYRNKNSTHRIGSKISWDIDSVSNLSFRPGITFRKNSTSSNYLFEGSSNYNSKLNESDNKQNIMSNDFSYTHDINYSHMFRKRQRSFFAYSNLYYGNNDADQYNNAENVFYNGQTTVTVLNQDRQRRSYDLRTNTQVNYGEPLTQKISLRFSNTLSYNRENNKQVTYDWDPVSGKYELLNNNLSNDLKRTSLKNNGTFTLEFSNKKVHFSPGISLQSINIKNTFSKYPSVLQSYFYVFPALYFYAGSFNGGYSVYINEPSAYDLQPVADNTNPLYQNFGNPDLLPVINHMISTGFNKYSSKKFISFNFYNSINLTDHSIIRERTVDDRGVQTTRPMNVNGNWSWNANIGIAKQYKLKNSLRVSIRPSLSFYYIKNYVIVNNNKSSYQNMNIGGSIMCSFNWKDLVEFNQRYNLSTQKSKYENDAFHDLSAISHASTTEFVIRLPKNWIWENTVDYRYNPQVAPGFSKNIFRWNAGINYLFLKQKKGQLRLYVFDILKKNTSAFRFVSENYIQDTESNTLTRFFLLSFTYNIRDFKGGKVGGRNNLFLF